MRNQQPSFTAFVPPELMEPIKTYGNHFPSVVVLAPTDWERRREKWYDALHRRKRGVRSEPPSRKGRPKKHRPIMSIILKRRGFNKKIIRHLSHLSRAILRRNCEKSGSGGEHKANRCGHLICSVFKYIISRPASEGNKVTGTFEKLCLPRQLHGSPIVFAIGRIKAIAKDLGTCSKPGTSHIVCRPGTC